MVKKNKKPIVERKNVKSYLKYSGMAFQIFAYLVVGVVLGKQLDKYFNTNRPYLTALCAVLFLTAYFIKLVIDLQKPTK